jgi:GntR family transcriptional regulator, transcriptional repressor for pyruvate dehydrogenase complex
MRFVPTNSTNGTAAEAFDRSDSPFARMVPSSGGITRGIKTSERIASALVEDIIAAGLGPGDRLPNEASMAERFGVGRGSVREALRLLEVHGMISLRSGPKGGPVIIAVDPRYVGRTLSLYLSLRGATIEEVVQTRLILEPNVARLAAEHLSEESSARLREALEAEAAGSESGYIDAANEFHYVLATITGNRVLDLVATALKDLYTTRVVGAGVAHVTTDPSIKLEHREIGEAILRGDGAKAESLMRAHMDFYTDKIHSVVPHFAESRLTWE